MMADLDARGRGERHIDVVPIETPSLGNRSYLVVAGTEAFVVDAQRDIDRVLWIAKKRGVAIRHVFETHVHNDYVSGGLALAKESCAAYHVHEAEPVRFERNGLGDGDVVEVTPGVRVRAVGTPGHTFTHLSYVVEVAGEPVAVFSGGSLLYGTTGRPDLLGPAHTHALARAQYASARRLADELPDDVEVYPTHGFGSFCAAAQTKAVTTGSTIGRERIANPVLTLDEGAYVGNLLAGLDAWPAYYAHIAPRNLAGPDAPDLSPLRPAGAGEVRRRIEDGEWVVDLRSRRAYSAGHVPGTLNFGLEKNFATYLGWLIPWDTPLTLLAESPQDVARAQRELARIGIDRPAAAAVGGPADWSAQPPAGIRNATFAQLSEAHRQRDVVVLDVRMEQEWRDTHIGGALHIPLHELPERVGQVPGGEVWVHCESGYRSSIAASILARAGRQVIAVDEDYAAAVHSGLPIVAA
jgi:hydroxyacylglutathione hydrolase